MAAVLFLKINILIDYLTNNKLDDDTILIVTDSFDVVFNDNIQNIINKYKRIQLIKKKLIIFL